ncbi:MAG TPA: fructosamine kinase family protein [Anaerolineaceae bacterium]|nr:fructosamine kinase family protein [Anaerolineaceae bacterium]
MTQLPPLLRDRIQFELNRLGDSGEVRAVRSLGGGCINNAARLEANEHAYFLKWNPRPLPGMFPSEATGLHLLRATGTVSIPEPYAAGDPAGQTPGFILMEWIETPAGHRIDMAVLGEQLAELHQKGVSPQHPAAYGLAADNFIGSTPQHNGWETDWIVFFRQKRLVPQIELAARNGLLADRRARRLEKLLEQLDRLLDGVDRRPCLLHGDLWGGNVMAGSAGQPVLIDPAVYFGDREADIAFTELFGGFSRRFYQAYEAAYPLEPGYADRRDLYNLYHLLNHLNLFGEAYGDQVDAVLRHTVG